MLLEILNAVVDIHQKKKDTQRLQKKNKAWEI